HRKRQTDRPYEEVDQESRVRIALAESLADEDRRGCRKERTAQSEQVHGLWHHGASPILLGGGHETLAQSTGYRRRGRPAVVGDVPAGRGCSRGHGRGGSSPHA